MTLQEIWALPPEEVDKLIEQLDVKPVIDFTTVSDGNPFNRFIIDEGMEKVLIPSLDSLVKE